MLSTIDNTHTNVLNKINALLYILNLLIDDKLKINIKLKKNIDDIYDDYNLGTVNILSNYYQTVLNLKTMSDDKNNMLVQKDYFFNEYYLFIKKENILTRINNIYDYIKKFIVSNQNDMIKETLNNIQKHIKNFEKSSIQKTTTSNTYNICICKNKMEIDIINSIIICKNCGIIKELCGMISEYDDNENIKNKNNSYVSSKHCKYWVDRIQGKETTEIANIDIVVTKLKNFIKRDRILNINYITYDIIRSYLKEIEHTNYNEHVTLLRKLITGITPPSFTDYEKELIYIYFDKIIYRFNEIKPKDKKNCSYHPYFIYKIIEHILPNGFRKIQILNCIHLQSRETLINNDIIFKTICDDIKEITYIPTDRNINKLD